MNKNNINLPIYMDYASTTPIDFRVVRKMIPYLYGKFGNSSSKSHVYGWKAKEAIQKSRENVSLLINSNYDEIIWTSGATESNNLAIKGCVYFYKSKGKHIITIKTEHKSVLNVCRFLEQDGYDVTYLDVLENGLIDLDLFISKIRNDTILVSVMYVNNEIGVIQDINKISKICYEKGIIFHVDAAQAAGKINIDVNKMPINLMSLSAHKIYGPKGVGALYINKNLRTRIIAQIHGGGHEEGFRSGTLATHQIVGMGEAFRIAYDEMLCDNKRITILRNILLNKLMKIDKIYINGDIVNRIPHNLNISFSYIEGESLIMAIKDIAVSSGSACASSSLESSYVLKAIGRSDELSHSSIRFTIGKFTTSMEINFIADLIINKVQRLRDLSPLWEMYKDGVDISSIKWNVR